MADGHFHQRNQQDSLHWPICAAYRLGCGTARDPISDCFNSATLSPDSDLGQYPTNGHIDDVPGANDAIRTGSAMSLWRSDPKHGVGYPFSL